MVKFTKESVLKEIDSQIKEAQDNFKKREEEFNKKFAQWKKTAPSKFKEWVLTVEPTVFVTVPKEFECPAKPDNRYARQNRPA